MYKLEMQRSTLQQFNNLTAAEETAVITAISALAGTNEFAAAVAGAVGAGGTRKCRCSCWFNYYSRV